MKGIDRIKIEWIFIWKYDDSFNKVLNEWLNLENWLFTYELGLIKEDYLMITVRNNT